MDLQALLSRADLRVKELRQSLDRLTAESEKLEVSFFSRLEGYRLLCRLPMYVVSQLEVECQVFSMKMKRALSKRELSI